jgi:hypothetical protein
VLDVRLSESDPKRAYDGSPLVWRPTRSLGSEWSTYNSRRHNKYCLPWLRGLPSALALCRDPALQTCSDLGDLTFRLLPRSKDFQAKFLAGGVLKGPGANLLRTDGHL